MVGDDYVDAQFVARAMAAPARMPLSTLMIS